MQPESKPETNANRVKEGRLNQGPSALRRLTSAAALCGATFALSACSAIPTPLSVATYAVDGVSYLVSGKSLTDHGISYVMGRDCALLRPIWGDPICKDYEDEDGGTVIVDADGAAADGESAKPQASETVIAFSGPMAPVTSIPQFIGDADTRPALPDTTQGWAPVPEVEDEKAPESLADFPTAAGTPTQEVPIELTPKRASLADSKATKPENEPGIEARKPALSLVSALAGPENVVIEAPVAHDLVMVVGSFADPDRAKALAEGFADLDPLVLEAKLDQGLRYRVAVGPYPSHEQPLVAAIVNEAGVPDAWPLRLTGAVAKDLPRRKRDWPAIGDAVVQLSARR